MYSYQTYNYIQSYKIDIIIFQFVDIIVIIYIVYKGTLHMGFCRSVTQIQIHKCDLGNNLRMIQSLTKKFLETIFDCNNNYYNYYTDNIL